MKLLTTLLAFTCFSVTLIAQKTLKPEIGIKKDISENAIKEYQKIAERVEKIEKLLVGSDFESLSKEDEKFITNHEGDMPPFATDEMGCSWYCGEGLYTVKSSSFLDNSENYKPKNAHDFDLSKTWATNKNKGIGESLSFLFAKSESLTVNEILFYNGYQKSETAWKNNSRAKKVALIINGKQYAILELQDVRNEQKFTIEAQKCMLDKNLTFEFKILEVYAGDKYTDLCISEINFNGGGVH